MTDDFAEACGKRYVQKVSQRLNSQNRNWLAVISGETGSGKSYSGLSLCGMISPKFNTNHVVFRPEEFLRLLTSGSLSRGDMVVFDEAGVGMSSRNWYHIQNKLLGAVLQTFRHQNIGVVFTVPNLSFIDIQCRKLFHAYLETEGISYKAQTAFLKVYDIQHNSRLDKTYFKHPRFQTDSGRVVSLTHLAVPKPSEELIKAYEVKKLSFTKQLNQQALESLTGSGRKENFGRDRARPLTPIQEEIAKDLAAGLVVPQIAVKRGVAERGVYQQLEYIRKKGVLLTPKKEGSKVVGYDVL